uniref:AlNc14C254G9690 protein n=1 Tax=Albugo laibachii Nc14 TaxID=890382 RepID=F0WTL1_9STRA|nr:AlNc14C254G9690 [Albugo laibachii Nc14]|eukprot:CCA24702.1 AlNc14C254G9690 [Albugo laibachii Nc14]
MAENDKEDFVIMQACELLAVKCSELNHVDIVHYVTIGKRDHISTYSLSFVLIEILSIKARLHSTTFGPFRSCRALAAKIMCQDKHLFDHAFRCCQTHTFYYGQLIDGRD